MEILRTRAAKAVRFIAAAAVMAAMAMTLAACDNSEQVIREGLNKELSAINDTSSDVYRELRTSALELEQFGVNADDFLDSWLTGYSYKIGDIKIDGGSATVDAEITIKKLGPVIDEFIAELETLTSGPDSQSLTQSQIMEMSGSLLADTMNNASTETTILKLECVRNGNTWEPSPTVDTEFVNAIIGESQYM
jgi:hypothetical protein